MIASDAEGLAQLALDGARMVTDIVEEIHAKILATIGFQLAPFISWSGPRTGSIPGIVYRSIHAGYDVTERALMAARAFSSPGAGTPGAGSASLSVRERERRLAILNGVWGDHLVASGNPLAIEMAFRVDGAPLVLQRSAIEAALPRRTGKLLVFVHGLCMNDLGWERDGHDHAVALGRDTGYTPLYLHYNTGLHVSTNGKRFAELLETLVREWPEPVEELAIVGHSMGGLLARSAAYYAAEDGRAWRPHLRRLICLGTPHHGSGLERLGRRVEKGFGLTHYSAPLQRLGASRSAGITDLGHGNVLDEDWEGHVPTGRRADTRCPAPLPTDVACYAAAATMGARPGDARDRLMGDGFVPRESALGLHPDPGHALAFPEAHLWTGYGMQHLDLLCSCEMYDKLQEWLAD